ncbi:hypothetical protein HDU86_007727 [Geranomyces michiganensis]|nr:hypothetical protein HDU86_007727 [Geranomyces michiganensis]
MIGTTILGVASKTTLWRLPRLMSPSYSTVTTSPGAWSRLIRFRDEEGSVLYGDIDGKEADLALDTGKITAVVLEGDPFDKPRRTSRIAVVSELLSPIPRPPIILGIGLNYLQHAIELGATPPAHPILFTKPGTAVTGTHSNIVIPKALANSEPDYEAELAVVIGKECKDVAPANAMRYIAGVTCANDVTARKWQRDISQWCFAKSFDTFCPLGPAIVAPHVLPTLTVRKGPSAGLAISLTLNGQTMQSSRTSDMIHNISALISFLSQGTTLLPGTVILTGTPQGVGTGRTPKISLQHGDRKE